MPTLFSPMEQRAGSSVQGLLLHKHPPSNSPPPHHYFFLTLTKKEVMVGAAKDQIGDTLVNQGDKGQKIGQFTAWMNLTCHPDHWQQQEQFTLDSFPLPE